jgi:hypothetical protein
MCLLESCDMANRFHKDARRIMTTPLKYNTIYFVVTDTKVEQLAMLNTNATSD